jgi:hypothetical protein
LEIFAKKRRLFGLVLEGAALCVGSPTVREGSGTLSTEERSCGITPDPVYAACTVSGFRELLYRSYGNFQSDPDRVEISLMIRRITMRTHTSDDPLSWPSQRSHGVLG